MSYLTNYGQKKSINNIQDLGLSMDSQQPVGWQLILQVIFRILYLFLEKLFLDFLNLQGIGQQPILLEFQKSINKCLSIIS
jgi:hypothetical protein